MKSFFLVSFLSFCLCGVEAKDHIDPKSNNLDLEELIRNHSGEIEELKHRIKIIEQSLGISHSEKVVLKDSKQIANKIKKKTPEEIIEMAKDLISLDRCQEARDILNAFISEHPQNLYCGRMYFYIVISQKKIIKMRPRLIWKVLRLILKEPKRLRLCLNYLCVFLNWGSKTKKK